MVHADLYRVTAPGELAELGFDDLPKDAVVLLEWPDRAAGSCRPTGSTSRSRSRRSSGPSQRNARITGYGAFAPRVERLAGDPPLPRRRAAMADAERAAHRRATPRRAPTSGSRTADATLILMNAPRRPDGPPVRDGKPYSAIAHLAEDVEAVRRDGAARLRERGFSAPQIHAADLDRGPAACSRTSAPKPVVAGDPPAPIEERYAAAVDVLVALHRQQLPGALPVAPRVEHSLPPYDIDAFLIEAELLLDWYLPHRGVTVTDAARAEFIALWREALASAAIDARRPGCCATIIRPTCSGCPSARASRASACSTSRTP